MLLILGGGIFALHSVYTVRTVYVEGNVHYTEDEIKKIVMSGPLGNNSLYLSLKYRDRGIQDVQVAAGKALVLKDNGMFRSGIAVVSADIFAYRFWLRIPLKSQCMKRHWQDT